MIVLSWLKPERSAKKYIYPYVTVLLTVHNEKQVIEERIKNLLASDYLKDLLEVLVASDGSTDGTNDVVNIMSERYGCIRLYDTERGGKSIAQNKAVPLAKGEIIILTDARTMFNSNTIGNLVDKFADARVGCASGKLVITGSKNAISKGQGFYWKYEILLRKLESKIGILHTASGSVMAFRKELFKPFEAEYGDDCVIPLDIVSQGYRVVHADNAIAYDAMPSSIEGELGARSRMTMRNISGTLSRYTLLNPFKYPLISMAILSHKILRWLTPYFMATLYITNLFLLGEGAFYRIAFYLQSTFYLLALIGFGAEKSNRSLPIASQAFSFMLASVGFLKGTLGAAFGQKVAIYKNKN